MLTRSCLFLILLLLSCVTSRSQVNSGPLIDIDSGRLEGAPRHSLRSSAYG
jgi:hypothetical protein